MIKDRKVMTQSKSFVGFFPQPAYYSSFFGSKVHLKAMYIWIITSVIKKVYFSKYTSITANKEPYSWILDITLTIGVLLISGGMFRTLVFLSVNRKKEGEDFKPGGWGSRQEKRHSFARGVHGGDSGGGRFWHGAVPWRWGSSAVLTDRHEHGKESWSKPTGRGQ